TPLGLGRIRFFVPHWVHVRRETGPDRDDVEGLVAVGLVAVWSVLWLEF
ncbi:MAG: hypothetical protein H0V36_05805, partial [Chloroflexi bacterium]|nr:hypothetical protein [Chloroflexota bacterium]